MTDTEDTKDTEIWADIPGTAGRYRISTRGRVRGPRGGLLKIQTTNSGYRWVNISRTQTEIAEGAAPLRHCYIGRTILIAFVSKPPAPDARAGFIDRDPSNTVLTNLAWMSTTETNRKKQKTGVFGPCCPHNHPYLELDGPNAVPSRSRRGHIACLACSRTQGYLSNHPELKNPDGSTNDAVFQRLSDRYWTRAVFGEFNSGNTRTRHYTTEVES